MSKLQFKEIEYYEKSLIKFNNYRFLIYAISFGFLQYFYSIKDISIGGRCMCNGHADTCDPADPEKDSSILVCRCQHNTCGSQCTACCPGFEQKKWRISQNWDRFACERKYWFW